jgi:small-conductance mechanosensitive channel
VCLGYLLRVSLFWLVDKFLVKTKNQVITFIQEMVASVDIFIYFLLATKLINDLLEINQFWQKIIDTILILSGTIFITTKVQHLIFVALDNRLRSKLKSDKKELRKSLDPSLINIIKYATTGFIWLLALLLLLQSFGVDLTAVLGGLGITGIAVAFALQNVLGDLFASISLYVDQPFRTGDFIVVGNESGTVEQIGLRTTRVRTLTGDILVFNNRKLTDLEVHNLELMKKRRIVINFGLEYATTKAQILKVLEGCKDLVKSMGADFSRVHFYRFGAYSLDFELVYYINTGNYELYMDSLQDCNLRLMDLLDEVGVSMAYPTQKIELANTET